MAVLYVYFLMAVLVKGEHSHNNHGGSPSEYKYKSIVEFETAFRAWIQTKTDVFSLTDMVDIISARLGVHSIVKCGPGEPPMLEALRNISKNSSLSDLLHNEQLRYHVFHQILFKLFEYHQCCFERREECYTRAKDSFDKMSVRRMFSFFEEKYRRLAVPEHFDKTKHSAYETEAFANRFMCVNEYSLDRTVYFEHGDKDNEVMKRNALLSALALYILQGYNLLSKNDICPGAYLEKIYIHYQLGDNLQSSSETFYYSIMIIFRIGFPDSRCQSDTLKESHQHETNFYSPHPVSERNSGIHFSDIKRSHPHVEHQPHSQWNQISDIGNFYRGHPPLPPHFSEPPNHRFLNYDWNFKESESVYRQCFDEQSLLRVFNFDNKVRDSSISMSLFLDMCPALLYKALFKPCHRHYSHSSHRQHSTMSTIQTSSEFSTDLSTASFTVVTPDASNLTTMLNESLLNATPPRYKGYLYGSLSVLVISLCSIVGAGFMKLSRADVKIYMMGSMLSLAVGCLVADATLHLLPEIVINEEDVEDDELVPDYMKKLCAFLASIYAFFVLELLLSIRHTHSHTHTVNIDKEQIKSISVKYSKDDVPIRETNLNLNNMSIKNNIPKTLNIDNGQQTDTSIQVLESRSSSPIQASPSETNRQLLESRCSSISDRISIHDAKSGVKALAWMIIIGDGIHNFADGLAIGAAFSLKFTKGISTSITVLCHELPHELGDFAVLVSTGMSVRKAMLLNFVSSLTAFAGLYLGLSLGEQAEASHWIFAVGAGMFLYVALTDLVPECKEYFKTKCTIKMFVGQNIGLLLGYVAMLLLAMYEDKLDIKL